MKDVIKELVGWIVSILLIVAVSYLIVTFVGQRTQVSGSSMETTLSDGDHLIVDKISYRFREPQRYEIVVFPYRYEKNTYINGKQLDEHYGNEIIEEAGMAAEPVTLGEDEYFVMGDNRNNSQDSRVSDVGAIHRDELMGRAWIRIWPLDQFGVIKHE